MICYLRYFVLFVLSVFLTISPVLQVVSYADINDLMIVTDSNALMTLSLDDTDYSTSLMSSLASVTNTINPSGAVINFNDGSSLVGRVYMSSDASFTYTVPSGSVVNRMQLYLYPSNMPAGGVYRNQVDFASHTSLSYSSFNLYTRKNYSNASADLQIYSLNDYAEQSSGDCYIDFVVEVPGNLSYYCYDFKFDDVEADGVIAGSFAVNFAHTDAVADVSITNYTSSEDTQIEISNNVAALQNTTNSIFDSLQDLIQHISNQLAALWDQMYNYMHVPHMAKLDEVIDAISNIDIEFQIDFDELKSSINNMSTAVQNKLQATTDQITGGFDNAQQATQNEQLSGAINEYDQIESDVFEDATGFMGELEYSDLDSMPMGIIKALAFIGGFLQSIFICMGDFSVIITFSLTMIFVMIVIGYHRIRS